MKGKAYYGYAFNKDHFVFLSIENQKERYTPTEEDIIRIENILRDSIDCVMKKYSSVFKSINSYSLKRYTRQYVGFTTKNGDVVIWINFLRRRVFDERELSSCIISVSDGGHSYWSVLINLTKNTLYGINVNGIS